MTEDASSVQTVALWRHSEVAEASSTVEAIVFNDGRNDMVVAVSFQGHLEAWSE